MKLILFLVLISHGLIHLLGFVIAFDLAKIEGFSADISKKTGLVWLLSMLLFLSVGVLLLLHKDWVWIPALTAVITSQALIFLTWQDAKIGTIPNLIILVFVIFSFAAWEFNNSIEKESESLLSEAKAVEEDIITEEMTASLPAPVQKWVKNIGLIGTKPVHTAYFEQKAKMKLKTDQADWYPAEVVQYVTTDRPGFLWKVSMKIFSVINVTGRDQFHDGQGAMTIKIGSLIPVVNEANDRKTNQSTLQRYLMELVWYPSAVLSPYITWEEVDGNTAKATMTYNDVSGEVAFYFDDSGNFLKVSAFRYNGSDENAVKAECIGEAKKFSVVEGIKIPTKVDITWVLEDGLFTWYKTEVLHVTYK